MHRLLLSSFLAISCVLAIFAVFEDLGTSDFLVHYLRRVGIPSAYADLANFLSAMLLGIWLSILIVHFIPSWRVDLQRSLPKAPLPNKQYLNHGLRAVLFYIVAVISALLVGRFLETTDLADRDFALISAVVAYTCFFLYELRGLLFPDTQIYKPPPPEPPVEWRLPSSITKENLGKPETRLELAQDLRQRAGQLRRWSLYSMAGIGVLLMLAILVILFAGHIAEIDVGVTNIEKARSIVREEKTELDQLRRWKGALQNEIKLKRQFFKDDSASPEDVDKKIAEKDGRYSRVLDENKWLETQISEQEIYVKNLTDSLNKTLSEVLLKLTLDDPSSDEPNLLIASGITRFGILFVMVFLMQVLVGLYRYTMRLSAHYLSQADALVLAPEEKEGLLSFVSAFGLGQVDFGKQPSTPSEQISRMLRVINETRSPSRVDPAPGREQG